MEDLTAIPNTITAGDSYGIVLALSDYPATSGWALSLAVAGPAVTSWASAAEGESHRLTLSATSTAALPAGSYQFRVRAVSGADVRTVQVGTLTVTPDLALLAAGEGVSWAEKTLAVVEAALSGTIEGEMKMYTIAGRQVMTYTPKELMALRAQLRSEVNASRLGTFGTPILMNVVGMR